jgi:hypothetical protein
MRQSAAWLLVAGLLCAAGCQRMVAKTGSPPTAPATGPASGETLHAGSATAVPVAGRDADTQVAVRPPGVSEPAPASTPSARVPEVRTVPQPKPRAGKEIVIAWEASLMYLLEDGKLVGKPLIVNGAKRQYLRPEHLGEFKITEKKRLKRSNLYDVNGDPLPDKRMASQSGAVMRNWMRLGNLAVGLHYSPAFRFYRSPGARHRSHGCYRMGRKSSDYVFKWAPIGTPVHVVRYLGGTEWQFLVAQTPAELLPGNQASRAASAPARRSAPSRSTGAGKPARKAAAAMPRNPAPVPEPVVSEPVPAPAPEPATAEPPQSAEPEPMPARALDSSANFPTAPETEPAPPIKPPEPAP